MVRNRSRVLAKLADWSQLRTGTPDAVDQLRQQLQAIGIEVQDPRALRLIGRAIALAEELHSGIGDEPEYMKRARLNYALARLCSRLEAGMADEMVRESLPPARGARQADTVK